MLDRERIERDNLAFAAARAVGAWLAEERQGG